jgi:replicative DNA helicase
MTEPEITPELGIVASVLLNPAWSWEVIDRLGLTPDNFRHSDARQMFSKLSQMREVGKTLTQAELAVELPTLSQSVWRVTDHFFSASPEVYADAVLEKNRRYSIRDLSLLLAQEAGNPEADLDALLDKASQTLNKVLDKGFTTQSSTLKEAAASVIDDLDNPPSYIPTPWPALNEALGGLRQGAFYVIAARPGMGKSLLGLQLASAIANPTRQVAFFSFEMNETELATRALASKTGINLSKIDRRELSEQDKQKLALAYKDLTDNLHLIATPSRQVSQLRPTLRAIRATKEGSLGAVFIDYLGLLDAPGQTLYEKVTKISGQLKSLAMELDIPLVALAQLNRKAEERQGSPSLADLRDSGSIEQDADAVLMLSNDESGHLSLTIQKNRQGPLGSFTGLIDRPTMTIKTFTKD